MQVHIHFLQPRGFQQALRSDGWQLTAVKGNACDAAHPRIDSEDAVRNRLYDLGLLTSAAVRIEFPVGAGTRRA